MPGQLSPPLDKGGQSSGHLASGHLSVLTELKVTTLGQTPGGGFHPVYEEHLVAQVFLPFRHCAPLYMVGNSKCLQMV